LRRFIDMNDEHIKSLCLEEEKEHALLTGHWDKEQSRIKQTGEVFTPTALVLEMIEQLPADVWEDGKTFLEPSCGNGQFLAVIAIVKRELGHKSVLASCYGVDLMEDNVAECKARLLAIAGDTAANRAIVDSNILCRDGLAYDYSFGTSPTESLFGWND
jgi:hypothetical protein